MLLTQGAIFDFDSRLTGTKDGTGHEAVGVKVQIKVVRVRRVGDAHLITLQALADGKPINPGYRLPGDASTQGQGIPAKSRLVLGPRGLHRLSLEGPTASDLKYLLAGEPDWPVNPPERTCGAPSSKNAARGSGSMEIAGCPASCRCGRPRGAARSMDLACFDREKGLVYLSHTESRNRGWSLTIKTKRQRRKCPPVVKIPPGPARDSKLATKLNMHGLRRFKVRKYREAEALFRKAIEADPTHAWSHYNLARTYCLMHESSCVGEQLQRARLVDHLRAAVLLKPSLRHKLDREQDLGCVRDMVWFQLLHGLSPNKPEDVRKILRRVTWTNTRRRWAMRSSELVFKGKGRIWDVVNFRGKLGPGQRARQRFSGRYTIKKNRVTVTWDPIDPQRGYLAFGKHRSLTKESPVVWILQPSGKLTRKNGADYFDRSHKKCGF